MDIRATTVGTSALIEDPSQSRDRSTKLPKVSSVMKTCFNQRCTEVEQENNSPPRYMCKTSCRAVPNMGERAAVGIIIRESKLHFNFMQAMVKESEKHQNTSRSGMLHQCVDFAENRRFCAHVFFLGFRESLLLEWLYLAKFQRGRCSEEFGACSKCAVQGGGAKTPSCQGVNDKKGHVQRSRALLRPRFQSRVVEPEVDAEARN